MTYDELLTEISSGQATLLSMSRVGPSLNFNIVVQRSSGAIWQAEDIIGVPAFEWGLPAQEFAYLHAARLFHEVELDGERLFRYINWMRAADEQFAAVEAAMHLLEEARR